MRKSQILTTVSVIALSAAGSVPLSAIISKPARANISIDWSFGAKADVVVDAGTTSVVMASEQENINNGAISAKIDNTFTAIPAVGFQDYGGGLGNTIDVIANDATSTAIGNEGIKSINLFTVSGPGTTGGGVSASAQINRGAVTIDSSVSATSMRIASKDLGAGNSQTLDLNLIEASTSGNIAENTITGDVNVLLKSTEDGKATVGLNNQEFLTASGTLMVGSMQINDGLASFTAGVTTSRIGSIAVVDNDTTAIVGIPLSIQDNAIDANITGNDSTNLLNVTDGKDTTLEGAIGVINAQFNEIDTMVIKASVLSSDIEAGDTTTGVDPIDKLDGSSIDFSGNDILATATGSTSQNTLKVDGVDINGSFDAGVAGDQDHTINTNAGQLEGHTRAFADVYLASLQFNEATVTASVGDVSGAGDIDDGDMNVCWSRT